MKTIVIARAIKLIEIVYRIFEYLFIKNIICSLTFVLALQYTDKMDVRLHTEGQ